uniref:Fibronectin type-III domain-containing protein n=1 Tax=Zonotrichia albicollis TaxID=44394 RepID=A0A8D2MMT5_ZONAL
MALPQRALTFFLALAPLLNTAQLTPSHLVGAEKCQKPQWDSRFIFDQEQEIFNPNEVVKIRCPEGYWPPPMEIKCVTLKPREGSMIPRSGWSMRSGTDAWRPVKGNLTCVDVRQVVPKIPEISSTSIKLKWTCRFPHICQNIRARCQTEWHSSSDCETEEVKVEEMLQGWEGTFICSPLQPFTVYSVTISRLPSTILYADLHTTKEMVPDKPEKLWVDTSTGSLRWKPLSSCKGEITGYQLNITTMRAEDGSFIDFSQVLVNQSVSEYVPPHQTAGNKYLVTVQGLTAAGAGPASQLEFQTYVLGNGCSALCLVGVASQGVSAESRAVCAPTLPSSDKGRELPGPPAGPMGQGLVLQSLPLPCPSRHAGRARLAACPCSSQGSRACSTFSGQPMGSWPGSAVTVVVVVVLLIPLSAGIIWFLLCRWVAGDLESWFCLGPYCAVGYVGLKRFPNCSHPSLGAEGAAGWP